jgi:hypothetical protein
MIFLGYEQKSKWYKFYNPNEGNMMISRDVEFNEEGAWNWKVNDGEKYDFLPILDEKEEIYEDHQEPIVSPLQTPMSSTFSPPPYFLLFLLLLLLVEAEVVVLHQVY